jgi:hypothetical protein
MHLRMKNSRDLSFTTVRVCGPLVAATGTNPAIYPVLEVVSHAVLV